MNEMTSLLCKWKAIFKKLDDTLQVGRYGADDKTYQHGEMDRLELCIEELEEVISKQEIPEKDNFDYTGFKLDDNNETEGSLLDNF